MIWAGLEPVANTEKKIVVYYEQLLRAFFFVSMDKKIIFKIL